MKDFNTEALDLQIIRLLAHFVFECNRLRVILRSRVFCFDKWLYPILQLGCERSNPVHERKRKKVNQTISAPV